MTSLFHISLTPKTAPLSGADLDVRAGRLGSGAGAMRRYAGPRTAIVEASNDLDALAARSAG